MFGSLGSIVFTCEIFPKLVFHLQWTFESLLCLLVGHSSVHFPARLNLLEWNSPNSRLSKFPYIIDSMDFGLMKIAMGYNWATCNLLMALPETSKMQCFLCCKEKSKVSILQEGFSSQFYRLRNFTNASNRGAIKIVVILSGFNE